MPQNNKVFEALKEERNVTATTVQPEGLMHRLTNLPAPAGSPGAGNGTTTNSSRRLTATDCTPKYEKAIFDSFDEALQTVVTADQAKWIMGFELFSCQVDGGSATAAFIQMVKPGYSAQADTMKVDVASDAFVAEFKKEMIVVAADLGVTVAAINDATPAITVVNLPAEDVEAVLTAAGAAEGAKVDFYYGASPDECEKATGVKDQILNECVDVPVNMEAKAWTCVANTVAKGNIGAKGSCPTEGLFMAEGACQRVGPNAFLKVKCNANTNSLSTMLADSNVLTKLNEYAASGSTGSSSTTSGAYSNGLSAFAFIAMAAAYFM
jgi:hypothetical protein